MFYPSTLPQRKWLEFYAGTFRTVELNVSFYRLPKREIFEGWYRRSPRDFLYAVKGSRYITHLKRLKECREPVSLLMENAAPLKEKLGVFLWQLPPRFKFEQQRLEQFCVLLSTLRHAKEFRHAFEFRDESWLDPAAYRMLEEFNFAFCIAHGSQLPFVEQITADFVYLRLHGGQVLYGSDYSDKEMKGFAEKIRKWKNAGKGVFVYFNNDMHGFAVKNAQRLKKLIDDPT